MGESVKALGAKPAGPAVAGERQQGRLLVHREGLVDGDAVPLQLANEQGIGELLADAIALLDPRTVAIGGAAPTDRPGLTAGLGIGVGLQAAALELLHQGEGHGDGGGDVGNRSRRRSGGSLMGRPEPAQSAAFLQGLGLMGHQLLQDCQQPGPVVRQLGIEVLDVVAGRGPGSSSAAHRHQRTRWRR